MFWKGEIDVKDIFEHPDFDSLAAYEAARLVVPKLQAYADSLPLTDVEEKAELEDLIENFTDLSNNTEADTFEFNYLWNQVYDWADYYGVWVGTF